MAVSSFAVGALATPVFFLGFVDSILAILFFNILGILPVAFFSTFGPVFGLRQMVLSRFFFGYYGVKISASSSFNLFLVLTVGNIFSCCAQHSCMYWLVLR
jgi:purine-cytosine permease-like protein